jgi:hypothetical protein
MADIKPNIGSNYQASLCIEKYQRIELEGRVKE